jgi:hypothetical protein
LRNRASSVAFAALLVFTVGSDVTSVHSLHGAADALVIVAHDASAHSIGASSTAMVDARRLDCLACAASHLLRHRGSAMFIVVRADESDGAVRIRNTVSPLPPVRAERPPLRAPPVSPVSA